MNSRPDNQRTGGIWGFPLKTFVQEALFLRAQPPCCERSKAQVVAMGMCFSWLSSWEAECMTSTYIPKHSTVLIALLSRCCQYEVVFGSVLFCKLCISIMTKNCLTMRVAFLIGSMNKIKMWFHLLLWVGDLCRWGIKLALLCFLINIFKYHLLWSFFSFRKNYIKLHFSQIPMIDLSFKWWVVLERAEIRPCFLLFLWDFCLFMIFLTFCSNIYEEFIYWVWEKIKTNRNFRGQRKTPIGENKSIYFYPDRVQSDLEHAVVIVEHTTSYKINYPPWQKQGQCSCQQKTKIFRENNSFANSNWWVSIIPYFFLTGRKKTVEQCQPCLLWWVLILSLPQAYHLIQKSIKSSLTPDKKW